VRGFGDFQRAQMRKQDPKVHDLFRHIRQTVDALEQLMFVSPFDHLRTIPKLDGVPELKSWVCAGCGVNFTSATGP
jgi:predicted  nucleic acid-binding Zn-ribbon protein